MKKTFKRLHLWLSLPFGLLISIICFSGAMLVFEDEITRLLHPERYTVSERGARLPAHVLVDKVAAVLPDSVQVTGITFRPDPAATAEVGLSQPRHAAMFVNPYTGEVIGRNTRLPFFKTMFALHRWLLDDFKRGEFSWGKTLVGASAIAMIVVLLTGLAVWLPRSWKALRPRLRVATGKGTHRFFFDLHSAGGFYALLLLLIMAITGPTWSFDWYRRGFYTLLGAELPQRKSGHHNQSAPHDEALPPQVPASAAVWEGVYTHLAAQHPDHRAIEVTDGTAFVDLKGWGNKRAFDRFEFDPSTGRTTATHPYATADRMQKAGGWVLSLHTGTWGGWVSKTLYFLAALFGATLPLTGCYLWLKRSLLRRRRA